MKDNYLDKINNHLALQAKQVQHPELKRIVDEAIQSGGKRIRPALCLMACEMFRDDVYAALPQAVALELFHTFSLVHDDIMDEAPMRRGKPSTYFEHGRDKAILGGDVVLILAFSELLHELDADQTKRVLACFTDIAVMVCEGQMMDMEFENKEFPSVSHYLEMIKLKTSVLIGASLKIGGIVGKASSEVCDQLYDFGVLQGLAFQIQDDILDAYGDPSLVGKKIGGDIIQGKKTLLTILCAEQAKATDGDFESIFYNETSDEKTKIANVKLAYDKYGVLDLATQRKEGLVTLANSILEKVEISELSRLKLKTFSEWLMNRSH